MLGVKNLFFLTFILVIPSAVVAEELFFADFQSINGIGIGTPVVHHGEAVGKVISIRQSGGDNTSSGYELVLGLSTEHASKVKPGTVALNVMSRKDGSSTLELFVPSKASRGIKNRQRIRGFTTFEQFWLSEFRG